jgi:centromere protein C
VQDDTALIQEDSFQLVNGGDEDTDASEEEPEAAPEPEEEVVSVKKFKEKAQVVENKQSGGRRGRPKKQDQAIIPEEAPEEHPESSIVENVEPVKKKGRPKKAAAPEKEKEPTPISESSEIQELPKKKGGRPKRPIVQEEPPEDVRPAKKSRLSTDASEAAKTKTKIKSKAAAKAVNEPKAKSRKAALDTIAESDTSIIKRGPPLPRKAGLAILRRETPMDVGATKTRSGRNSTKPVAWWKGETIEWEIDAKEDQFANTKFVTRTIKDVVRVDEVEPPKRHRAKSRAPRSKKRIAEPESEDEADLEPWELEPGRMTGAIRMWDPVDQLGSQSEEVEDEIALSAAAIITRDIPNATFKFAKTLTLPFFGSGMVDLPPGGIKKQKNSRKMQMVFFVHRGRVSVTVNDTAFRIGQGGMWQVPRGEATF